MQKQTKILLGVLVVGALVVGALAYYQKRVQPKSNQTQDGPPQVPPVDLKVTETDKTKLPDKFPADFPLEKGAEILQNYTAQGEKVLQSTREFISKKSLAENFALYKKYLTDKKWYILSSSDTETFKSLSAFNATAKSSVSVSLAPYATGQTKVTISFVFQKE